MKIYSREQKNIPPCVYVGTGSPWDNPFKLPSWAKRSARERHQEEILNKFESYFLANFQKYSCLKGKDLVCWCPPQKCKCHASIIVKHLG